MEWLETRCGPVVTLEDLTVGKARDFAAFLMARDDVGAHVVELREGDGKSWVVTEFENDVGQMPVVSIERRERVALGFGPQDRDWPKALVVREDFPGNLSHTFLVPPDEPVTLCLSEEPWDEIRRRWTPNLLVRTIRHWFRETAKGQLHHADQALEPFVVGSVFQAILPPNVEQICAAPGSVLHGYRVESTEHGPTQIVRFFEHPLNNNKHPVFAAGYFCLPPQLHGFIRHSARHVADLIDLLTVEGFDFKEQLIATLKAWLQQPALRSAQPIFIVSVPMTRTAGGAVERVDTRLFMLNANVRELGLSLDIWSILPGANKGEKMEGPAIGPANPAFDGTTVAVMLWSTLTDLTREAAAKFNGYEGPSGKNILAIGAGALGSQVIGNLTRMGELIGGVADQDLLLPHNLARHGVYSDQAVGMAKSTVVAFQVNDFLSTAPETTAYTLNILRSEGDEAFRAGLEKAEVILDLAASVAVSRSLAIDAQAKARRSAAFLSPSGRDLIVLVEDADRSVRLDHLEMAYYAAVATDQALDGHLAVPGRVRYGQSCRDLSGQIEQAHLSINAGIAAKVVRAAIAAHQAVASVWRTDPATLEIKRIDLDLRPMDAYSMGEWTVLVRPGLMDTLWRRREQRLPKETGGVLLGDFDASRKLIYLVEALSMPTDSKEDAGSFIRGAFGLPEALRDVEGRTQLMLRYAGEWHSHPTGAGVMPSGDDVGLYGYMAEEMAVEGYPPIMLIAGDNEFSLIVEDKRIPLDRHGAA